MSAKYKSQTKRILKWMQDGKEISARDASIIFGCDRLSARICELRKAGYKVLDRWEKTIFGKKYKVYFM